MCLPICVAYFQYNDYSTNIQSNTHVSVFLTRIFRSLRAFRTRFLNAAPRMVLFACRWSRKAKAALRFVFCPGMSEEQKMT